MIRAEEKAPGIDIVNDGEMSKPSYAAPTSRTGSTGFGGESHPLDLSGPRQISRRWRAVFGDPGRARRKTPGLQQAPSRRDPAAAGTDAANTQGGAFGRECRKEGFLSAASPRLVSLFFHNGHYPSTRGLSRGDRRGDAPGIRGGGRRRLCAAARLSRPRDGPAHPERAPHHRGVPQGRGAAYRGAEPCAPQRAGRPRAGASVLGQLRGATSAATCRFPRHHRRRSSPRSRPGLSFQELPTRATHTNGNLFRAMSKLPAGKVLIPGVHRVEEPISSSIPELIGQRIGRYARAGQPRKTSSPAECAATAHWTGQAAVDTASGVGQARRDGRGARIAFGKEFLEVRLHRPQSG